MDYPMTVTNQSQKSKDSNTSQDFSSKNIKKKDFPNKVSEYSKKVIYSLKVRIGKIVNMLKEFVQKIKSFITKKLSKIFKTNTMMVAQKFYNKVMNLINEVDRIAPNPIQKFKLDTTLFTGNQEYVRKVYDELEYQYSQLNARAKNVSALKPEKGDKIITIRTTKLENTRKEFITIINNSLFYIDRLTAKADALSTKEGIPLNEVTPHISSLIKAANLTILKGCTIISLVNKLLNSGYRSEEEMKKAEYDNIRASTKSYWSEPPKMIAEESMRNSDIKNISKTSSKDIEEYNDKIFRMPESNEKEIKEKMKKIKEIRDLIGDYTDKLKDMEPDSFDRLIGALGKIGNIALSVGSIYYTIRNDMSNKLGVKSTSSYYRSFIAILGVNILNNAIFKKACISDKKKARDMLIQELKVKDKQYETLEKNLKVKLS